jgi:hypothetical protein
MRWIKLLIATCKIIDCKTNLVQNNREPTLKHGDGERWNVHDDYSEYSESLRHILDAV